jgi:hypothetical protein
VVLDEVYALLMQLDEEPANNTTWDVLDANAARDDLISKDEFLVFISIKVQCSPPHDHPSSLHPHPTQHAPNMHPQHPHRARASCAPPLPLL